MFMKITHNFCLRFLLFLKLAVIGEICLSMSEKIIGEIILCLISPTGEKRLFSFLNFEYYEE